MIIHFTNKLIAYLLLFQRIFNILYDNINKKYKF